MAKQARVTHTQFYAICQWVKGHADLQTPTTQQALAIEATKYLGFAVAAATVADALAATELSYTPIAAKGASNGHARSDDCIILARAIVHLSNKLGEEAPPGVQAIAGAGRAVG